MQKNTCESCGGKAYKTVLHNQTHNYQVNGNPATWHYALLQCTNCGMGFISPKPTFELLQTFYSADYGCYVATMDLAKETKSLKYKIAKLRYATVFEHGLSNSIRTAFGVMAELLTGKVVSYALGLPLNLAKNSRILEVGYGSGSWLLVMAQLDYIHLHGYDINANVENKTRLEAAGVKVHSGNLLDMALPDDYFDCIRLEHVFEHLLEPHLILSELHRILKPKGILVMSFPSINCMSFSLSPLHSALRESPRHLYLHTTDSARNIISKAGFKIKNVRVYPVVLQLQAVINNILKAKEISFSIKGFSLLAPFYHLINVVAKRGEFITLWATK
jgi:ubiquinone/menaquinone biosynthesis C-methylase UbiE